MEIFHKYIIIIIIKINDDAKYMLNKIASSTTYLPNKE